MQELRLASYLIGSKGRTLAQAQRPCCDQIRSGAKTRKSRQHSRQLPADWEITFGIALDAGKFSVRGETNTGRRAFFD
jgi:hypothetical protein